MTTNTNPPDTTTWVVFTAREGSESLLAWCKPDAWAPGFQEIHYTDSNGFEAYVFKTGVAPRLMAHLFTVTLPLIDEGDGEVDRSKTLEILKGDGSPAFPAPRDVGSDDGVDG